MSLGTTVMGIAAAVVLFYIWWRTRRPPGQPKVDLDRPGRFITDEAAAAFEDIAAEIMDKEGEAEWQEMPADPKYQPPRGPQRRQ